MNALSSHNDFRCTFKSLIDMFLKSFDEETDTMLGNVPHNLWEE